MKKFFKWLSLFIIATVAGVAILVYNPGLIKSALERHLSELTGYSISLHGELNIEPGRMTEVTAQNIRISGPEWASHDDLVSIRDLKLSLLTASLFKDIIILESLTFMDLDLNLETNADGKGNWLSANLASSMDGEEPDGPVVIFRNVASSNANIRFRNGRTETENVLHIATLSHHQKTDDMLHTSLVGALNNRPVTYKGMIGPYSNLLDGRDISFTTTGQFGDLKLSGHGQIDDLLAPRRPVFDLELQGPEIDEITAMLQIDDLGSGGFSLRARGGEVGDLYEADINGKVGDVSISASLSASDLDDLNQFDLKAGLSGPSLRAFAMAFGLTGLPDKPFGLKGNAERLGGTLNISSLALNIGGTQFLLDALLSNFPSLEASRMKLSISGDNITQFHELLGISGLATGPFQVQGRLDVNAEGLELVQVELETELGQATISGTLHATPGYVGSELQLHLDGENAHSLMSTFKVDGFPEQPFTLNARVEVEEGGLQVERGVLVTIEDVRLDLGGFIALNDDMLGTNLGVGISGKYLNRVLQRFVGETGLPDQPYSMMGRVQVLEDGIHLDDVKVEFEDINLITSSIIKLGEPLTGTGFDFQIEGADLSSLRRFEFIGDSLDILVPGQSYQASGRFIFVNNGWRLDEVNSRIGATRFDLNAFISDKDGGVESTVSFSTNGPGLNSLLQIQNEAELLSGAFESSGQLKLLDKSLNIRGFKYKSGRAQAKVNMDLDLPFVDGSAMRFEIDIEGDDIRYLTPPIDAFEFQKAPYKIKSVGNIKGDHLSLDQFESRIGELQIYLNGEFDQSPTNTIVEIGVGAMSKDISSLGRLYGKPLPALALDLQTYFKGNLHRFILKDLKGSFGESQLEGDLDVSLAGPKPRIKLTVNSSRLDIRPFIDPAEPDENINEQEPVSTITDGRVIPATPLPLDALATADVSLMLNIDELVYHNDSLRNLILETEIQSGELRVPRFSLDAPIGKLKSSFSIVPDRVGNTDVKIDLVGQDIVFNLSGHEEDQLARVPRLDIDIHVTGKGRHLREVAGTANGTMFLGSKGGTLEGVDLSLLDSFILDDIFSLLMPESKTPPVTQLSCFAAKFNIKNGFVKTRPALAFTSRRVMVETRGTLDLRTEKMHFNFNATPNNAWLINTSEVLQPYILISGSMSQPEVGIDPAQALFHGGAAIGTAGLSILVKGLLDRIRNSTPLCEEMLRTGPASMNKPKRRAR